VHVGHGAAAAVVPVKVDRQADTHAASGAGLPQAGYLAIVRDLVELKSSKLHSLVDVLHFLGLGVGLLLSLLATTAQSQNQVQGALLLDVVIRESSAVLELLAGEDQSLLIRGDSLLVLNLLLHIFDGIRRLDIERDGFTREGLDEDLHFP